MDNSTQLQTFELANPYLVSRGIDEPKWNALLATIYPGAMADSVIMAIDYCVARNLDIMLKPVHLVPMKVKDKATGQDTWRDVVMPGIGLYRIQADRSGNYAGNDEPEFGPTITIEGIDSYNNKFCVSYPEWCKYTVRKIVSGNIVAFTAKEYWLENYAVQKAGAIAPNAMWKKRPFAQLAKCAEAQALRKAWPEVGSEPTVDEMEGKHFEVESRAPVEKVINPASEVPGEYPQDKFDINMPKWTAAIKSGKVTADNIITKASSKYPLSDAQIKLIQGVAA